MKLREYDGAKDEAGENQAKTYMNYKKYRKSVVNLNEIKNENALATNTIDRGIEQQYNVITMASHVTIGLLNLDAKLELFNYQNFKFLVTTTPEIESLKAQYN